MSGFHSQQTTADGLHIITRFSFSNITDRDAASYVPADIGGVARVGSAAPYSFYILTNHNPPTWDSLSGGGSSSSSSSGPVVGVPTTYSAEAMNWKVHVSEVIAGAANASFRYADTQVGDQIDNPQVRHSFGTVVAANPIIASMNGNNVVPGTSDLSPMYIITNMVSSSERPREWDNTTVYPGKQAVEPTFFYPITIEHETSVNNIQFEFGHLGVTGQTSPNFYEFIEVRLWIKDSNGDINPAQGNYISVIDLDPNTVPAPLSSIMPQALDTSSALSAVTIPAANLGLTASLEPQTALLEVKYGIGAVAGTNGVSSVKNISLNNVVGGSTSTVSISSYTAQDIFDGGNTVITSSGTGAVFEITPSTSSGNITSLTITPTVSGSGYSKYTRFTVNATQLGGTSGEITFTVDSFADPEPEDTLQGYVIRNPILNGSSISAVGSSSQGGNQGSHVHSIDDLSDVDTSTNQPTQNQVLVWDSNSSPGKWVPGNQTSATGTIVGDRIEDTTLSSAARLIAQSSSTGGSEQLSLTGNIIPTVDAVYNLGSSAKRFNELYLNNSTIHMGSSEIGVDSDGDLTNNQAKIARELKATDPEVLDITDPSQFVLGNVDSTFFTHPLTELPVLPFTQSTAPIGVGAFFSDLTISFVEEHIKYFSIDDVNDVLVDEGVDPNKPDPLIVPRATVTMNAWPGATADAPTHLTLIGIPVVGNKPMENGAVMILTSAVDASVVSSGGTVTLDLTGKAQVLLDTGGSKPMPHIFYKTIPFLTYSGSKQILWTIVPSKLAPAAFAEATLTLAGTPQAVDTKTVEIRFGHGPNLYIYRAGFKAGNGAAPTQWGLATTPLDANQGGSSTATTFSGSQQFLYEASIFLNDASGAAKSTADLFTEIANLFSPTSNTTNGLNPVYVSFSTNGSSTMTFTAAKLPPFGPAKISPHSGTAVGPIQSSTTFFIGTDTTASELVTPDFSLYQDSSQLPLYAMTVHVKMPINMPKERETNFEKNVRAPKVLAETVCITATDDEAGAKIDFSTQSIATKSVGSYILDTRPLEGGAFTDLAEFGGAVSEAYTLIFNGMTGVPNYFRNRSWEFFGLFTEAVGFNIIPQNGVEQAYGQHSAGGFQGITGYIPRLGIVMDSHTQSVLASTKRDVYAHEWNPGDILINPNANKVIHVGTSAAENQEIVFNGVYYFSADDRDLNIGTLPELESPLGANPGEFTVLAPGKPILTIHGEQTGSLRSHVHINPFVTGDTPDSQDRQIDKRTSTAVALPAVLDVNRRSEDNSSNVVLSLQKEFNVSSSGTIDATEEITQRFSYHFHGENSGVKSEGDRVTAAEIIARPTDLDGTITIANNQALRTDLDFTIRGPTGVMGKMLTLNYKKGRLAGGLELGDPALLESGFPAYYIRAAEDQGMLGVESAYKEPYILKDDGYVEFAKQTFVLMGSNAEIHPCRVGTVMVTSDLPSQHTLKIFVNPTTKFIWDAGDVITVHNSSSQQITVMAVEASQPAQNASYSPLKTTVHNATGASAFNLPAGQTAVIACSHGTPGQEQFRYHIS